MNSISKKASAGLPKDREEKAARLGAIPSDHVMVRKILERAPQDLREWIKEVLVVIDSSVTDTIAESVAGGKRSRRVVLHAGLFPVQDMFSFAHQEFFKVWSPWLSSQLAQVRGDEFFLQDTFSVIQQLVRLFAEQTDVSASFDPVIRTMRALDEDLSALPDVLADVDRGRSGQHAQAGAIAGTLFIFAHELSHHLLGHTRSSADSRAAPAVEYLEDALDRLGRCGYLPPEAINRGHQQEFEADALAFLLIFGQEAGFEGRTQRLYDAAQGAFVALPSLALSNAVEAERGGWRRDDDTHPPFDERARAIAQLAAACDRLVADDLYVTTETGLKLPVSPTDYLQQLWACHEYLWILMQEEGRSAAFTEGESTSDEPETARGG